MPIVCPVLYASRWDADRVMNDLLGNHIKTASQDTTAGGRPVEAGTVFVGTRSWYYVASGSFSVVKF